MSERDLDRAIMEQNMIADNRDKAIERNEGMINACYECEYRGTIPGNAHSKCGNGFAKVTGDPQGIKGGWFHHPYNFDPTWLVSCDGFKKKSDDTKEQ